MTVYREPGIRPVYEEPPKPKPRKTFQPRDSIERSAKLATLVWGFAALMTTFAFLCEVYGERGFQVLTSLRLVTNVAIVWIYGRIWWKAYRPVEE